MSGSQSPSMLWKRLKKVSCATQAREAVQLEVLRTQLSYFRRQPLVRGTFHGSTHRLLGCFFFSFYVSVGWRQFGCEFGHRGQHAPGTARRTKVHEKRSRVATFAFFAGMDAVKAIVRTIVRRSWTTVVHAVYGGRPYVWF